MSSFHAHSHPDWPHDSSRWEPLYSDTCQTLSDGTCRACLEVDPDHGHLNKVASLAGQFASGMFPSAAPEASVARAWGQLAGLWHDLGKFAPEWQAYLRAKTGTDLEGDEASGRIDHSTAGGQHAVARSQIPGHLLAFAILGHHGGLADAISEGACLEKRLEKSVPEPAGASRELLDHPLPELPSFVRKHIRNGYTPAFFVRMLFSCLVDADFLATESFMRPDQAGLRPAGTADRLPEMAALLNEHLSRFPQPTHPVDQARAAVLDACSAAASERPGLFSLTVPTGGGKTLSSLAFALRHALHHGQRRIIYVVPFTSIIEQNAAVFRSIFEPLERAGEPPIVLEHHSNLSPERESTQSRLASENWDAPLIVTTAVRFYESLHAARTSSCRRLHRTANAVVILDEAQCLPVDSLRPCLEALRELSGHYRTSVVLCTATQPAVGKGPDFPIGLEDIREIAPEPDRLYESLKRVEVEKRGPMDDAALTRAIEEEEQVLAIVNTRNHAQLLFRSLRPNEGNFHLSASMCPAHRRAVLGTLRKRLDAGEPVRLVSTQVVEAGVDLDFPVVYRAMAGIDSIAQAAGRCNRNGRLSAPGRTIVFESEHQSTEVYFRETAQVSARVLAVHPDPLSLEAVHTYFELYYLGHRPGEGLPWDRKDITGLLRCGDRRELPFLFQFRTVADRFQLIESEQISVIIPYDTTARSWVDQLRNESIPIHRDLLRGLQSYSVQLHRHRFREHSGAFESLRDGAFQVLICPELHYSAGSGLNLEDVSPTALTV